MTDLRERRKNRTADTIRQVALDLVYRHGLDNVTTEMISTAAGVSPRTFFNYFPFKEAALIPDPPELLARDIDRFVTGTGNILADLADLLAPINQHVSANCTGMKKLTEISQAHPKLMMLKINIFDDFEKAMTAVIARRLNVAENDAKPCLMAALVVASIRVAIGRWVDTAPHSVPFHVRAILQEIRQIFDD